MLFVFDGGQITPEQEPSLRLDPAELSEYAFTDPNQLDQALNPRLARRLNLALDARKLGHPLYAEHGKQPELVPQS